MQKEDIHLTDLKRIFIGEAPGSFLLEVLIRTAVIYVVLLIAVRLLGKRMTGQLTIVELAVMLTLGAIVSIAMQLPDHGLLQGVVALVCALVFQRGLTLWDWTNPRVETVTQGGASCLVRDGVIAMDAMAAARISREQLFALLRTRSLFNLGAVKRAYLEACGEFSVYPAAEERPGLSVLPPEDKAARSAQPAGPANLRVCLRCGRVEPADGGAAPCPNCGGPDWTRPITGGQLK
jgi:uncharacterized membrane protein YcaP (DUF421 family)